MKTVSAYKNPVAWAAAAILLSAVTSYVVVRIVTRTSEIAHHRHDPPPGPEHGGDPFHNWLHSKLVVTPEQEAKLHPLEAAYAGHHAVLLAQVESAGKRLAQALDKATPDTTEIDAALEEIQAAQGELQKLTIRHFLEMKEHLSPDQAANLIQWTRDSITHEHRP